MADEHVVPGEPSPIPPPPDPGVPPATLWDPVEDRVRNAMNALRLAVAALATARSVDAALEWLDAIESAADRCAAAIEEDPWPRE